MIEFENVNVVFGKQPQQALPLIDQGLDRAEIRDKTGLVVGVQNANLSVKKGEICVLMGLSGSGKSSLLRCVNGLNDVTSGAIRIQHDGEMVDFTQASEKVQRDIRTRRISMVFQSFALMPWLTVEDNVAFGLELQGMSKNKRRKKVARQLDLVGLSAWAKCRPDELSGGMRQRVGLARALATESEILLMDEPFSALDPLIRHQLQDELLSLQDELQKTIVFVSHDLDEALKLGSHIAIMKDGQIVQHGKPESIVLHPENDYVKSFVASTNPLNVLAARSLALPIDEIQEDAQGNRCLNKRYDIWLHTPESAEKAVVTSNGQTFQTQPWQEGQAIDSLAKQPTRIAPNTPLRDAVEIRYFTGHSLLVEEGGQITGAIGDRELYHAMLGKHLDD
ncbi:glycine betaine/proline betaine transport system ATP-binding protein ProV [Marinobacter sp. JH2]|uniref:choline ABC transporter ATP-binding protein n=1 Tax=Marinobacter sp. AL4B TaxID=2871173 RepID=UPI001056992A|nr:MULTISPECIES: choline ABC transporter ATP-binding protein [unclassified Marinobacter]MBZ0334353.1 choline ABC transporter ATP-binding protein [Marinobacter sp. AL4B]QBM17921.1 glycine betaine/proline betaine transport system ATP-binding protein ProV [Marinobacter sp. JH2]